MALAACAAQARAHLDGGGDNEVPVVVGARSALFLPYADLGLIVVDEEHDPAYKQEDGVRYHARDMAVVRAREAENSDRARVGDAVGRKRSECAARALRASASAGAVRRPASAAIEAIDLRREGPPRGRFISPRLAEAVKIALERGEQALLFLNRRGFAPLTLCSDCGYPARLPELRRLAGRSPLQAAAGLPPLRLLDAAAGEVPEVRRPNSFVACRPGRRAAGAGGRRAVSRHAMLVLSSDLVELIERLRQELDDVAEGRFDIVIGTQLVAKGHHFPKLNLVGIVDADLGLVTAIRAPPSARSSCCIRWSAAPAARRAAATAILQTHHPEHPVMRALIAQDRKAF